jgi:hypothetical protein
MRKYPILTAREAEELKKLRKESGITIPRIDLFRNSLFELPIINSSYKIKP